MLSSHLGREKSHYRRTRATLLCFASAVPLQPPMRASRCAEPLPPTTSPPTDASTSPLLKTARPRGRPPPASRRRRPRVSPVPRRRRQRHSSVARFAGP